MRSVRSKDTLPEMVVRRAAHALGYRYRLHAKGLPGKPDLAFLGRKRVIFVHGCFWHGHNCKRGSRVPKSNVEYWTAKVARNCSRDETNIEALKQSGWDVLVLWECELKDPIILDGQLAEFLGGPKSRGSLGQVESPTFV